MFAVVLVGGYGTRLRPLTDEIPKPMLPVVNRPMIARLVDHLATGGVTDVVLALGFKPEPFEIAFPEGVHHGPNGPVNITFAVEPEPLDTAGAIAFAARHAGIDSTFVVANGDIITDLAVADLVARHRVGGQLATIHLTHVDDPSKFGVVECDADGVVERFVEKPEPGESASNMVNTGTYVLEPEVIDLIPSGIRVSVERDTFPKLVADRQLGTFTTSDYWIDAGRPELFLAANLDLVDGTRGDEPGIAVDATVAASADVVRSVVGPDVDVAEEAAVSGSVLLGDARIGRGAQVLGSIVAGTVGPGAVVVASVIGAGYTVAANAEVSGQKLPSPE